MPETKQPTLDHAENTIRLLICEMVGIRGELEVLREFVAKLPPEAKAMYWAAKGTT